MPTIKQVKCKLCGYEWFPRKPKRPGQCPNCGKRTWDDPEPAREPKR